MIRVRVRDRTGAGGARLLERLDVVNQIVQRVDALVHGERVLVVLCAQECGHVARGCQVRRPGDADAECVQALPHVVRVARLPLMPANSLWRN